MSEVNKVGEALGVALTGARYLLAERMAKRVKDGEPITLDMATFMAADVLDGVLLREFDLDTPARRMADGFVDYASIARVSKEVYEKSESSRPYILALAARAAFVGMLNSKHLQQNGRVTHGLKYQKATTISMAAFGVIASTGNRRATHIAGAVVSGVAGATAIAHAKELSEK